jgi:hypothetical protein
MIAETRLWVFACADPCTSTCPGASSTLAGAAVPRADLLTLDGNTGAVFEGAARTVSEAPAELLQRVAALRADAVQDP